MHEALHAHVSCALHPDRWIVVEIWRRGMPFLGRHASVTSASICDSHVVRFAARAADATRLVAVGGRYLPACALSKKALQIVSDREFTLM